MNDGEVPTPHIVIQFRIMHMFPYCKSRLMTLTPRMNIFNLGSGHRATFGATRTTVRRVSSLRALTETLQGETFNGKEPQGPRTSPKPTARS